MSVPIKHPHRMIWFFEGVDKAGKTTLARRCRFEAEPAHPALMFDRGYVSRELFYHEQNEEMFPIEDWQIAEEGLRQLGIYGIVWLRADPLVCFKREQDAGEYTGDYNHRIASLTSHNLFYQRTIPSRQRRGVPVIEIWTDRWSEDKCVSTILRGMGFKWKQEKI